MQIRKSGVFLIIFLGIGMNGLFAQESISTTGGNAPGDGGTASYSIGQIVYSTNSGTSGSVVQGVQQPFEISVVTGIEDAQTIALNCSVFPNPTSGQITLSIDGDFTIQYVASLYDINGRLLRTIPIVKTNSDISMKDLPPNTYFLKIVQRKQGDAFQEIKTFKIVKN